MRFDIITLFPDMVDAPFRHSLMGKARERGVFSLVAHDLREYAEGRHRVCDDYPFGGGEGMVMKVEPIARALAKIRNPELSGEIILLTPGGAPFTQQTAQTLAQREQLVFLCGHYEGVDERVLARVDRLLSIGDYVLTGGELAAMVVVEAVARLLPSVVGDAASLANECFSDGLLDFPQFTRPREFDGMSVPEVLLSGDHGKIARWRRQEALRRTLRFRPELLEHASLSAADLKTLRKLRDELSVALQMSSSGDTSLGGIPPQVQPAQEPSPVGTGLEGTVSACDPKG